MRRHSLESRLCLLVAGLLFALLLAVGQVEMTGQRAALVEGKIDKYQSLSSALALTYAPLAQQNDVSQYRAFSSRLMKADEDISYVVISDSNGKVLFADSRGLSPRKQENLIRMGADRLRRFARRITSSSDEEFKKISMPAMVSPNQQGTISVGFRSRSVDAATEEMQTRLFGTFAVAFIVGILGAMLLAKAIVRPIKSLIEAARRVAAGNLDIAVPISSTDEIGELGETFNGMVSALKKSRDKLIERANTDSLTDLYNHRYFQERLGSELSRAERYERPLSAIILDIDHFKGLNDTHGHPVGDMVLQEVAKTLVAEVRDIDVVARYGGEEFAVILPETVAADALLAAERLRVAIQRHYFEGKDGETVQVTVSLGVAQYPIHSVEREGLIMAADLAMYQAKSLGRNRAVAFSSDIRTDKGGDPHKLYLLLHAKDVSTIEAIAAAVDAKGKRYPGSSYAMMAHSVSLSRALGLSDNEQEDVRIASLLHDVGKLGVSDTILNKREQLTEDERRIVRSHPTLGYAIVQKSPHLKSMLPGILYHHEAWDGSGYPNCLKGEEIPMIARIIAVVDAYHAMLAERPYDEAKTPERAKAELQACAGKQFDPKVVDAFVSILEEEAQPEREAA